MKKIIEVSVKVAAMRDVLWISIWIKRNLTLSLEQKVLFREAVSPYQFSHILNQNT